MSREAKEVWDHVAPELERLAVITVLDGYMLGVWCELVAEYWANPPGAKSNKIAQMRGISACFGLDPASRTRIVAEPPEEHDPAEEFMRGR